MTTETVTVDDCDEYLDTFVSGTTRIVLAGRGRFTSRTRRARTDAIWIRQAETNLANTLHLGVPGRAVFAVNAAPDPRPAEPHRVDGGLLERDCISWQTAGAEATVFDPGGLTCTSFSFPLAAFHADAVALFGKHPVQPRSGCVTFRMPAATAAAFRRLLALGLSLPAGPTAPMAAELCRVTLACLELGRDAPAGERPLLGRQRAVADGLVALARSAEGQPLPLAEVCRLLRVNLRTLNNCSNAILGMSAGRYLRARRIQAVRRLLRTGTAASVTDAATRCGFFELGRFAGEYRDTFGERPAETLRRARIRPLPAAPA